MHEDVDAFSPCYNSVHIYIDPSMPRPNELLANLFIS